ncbi:MAG: serine hydrolase, partial [Patescibacteria group bacterium]
KGKYTLKKIVRGTLAREQLRQMISISNNASWYAFNDILTYRGEAVYAKSIGITYGWITNSITPRNMTTLLAKLYRRELLNKEHTNLLLSFMKQTHNMTLIPGSNIKAQTYNKTGRLDGLVHDTAIVDDGVNQYAIAIFTDGKTTLENRAGLFHEITEAVMIK